MILQLAKLPAETLGIYPLVRGKPNRTPAGRMPARGLFLHPKAVPSFLRMGVRCSDIFRSAAESLHAVQTKAGTKPPGYSGHGFGLCIDIDVEHEMQARGLDKPSLDAWMRDNGWHCHRLDGKLGPESWHYNHLGDMAPRLLAGCKTSTAPALEALVVELYGPQFALDDKAVQRALQFLGFYMGAIDGVMGSRTALALEQFRRAWGLGAGGPLDAVTTRTLAYVTAERVVLA